ncbi:MAG TPA: O-antigen ligase domain-containing protein, partial [Phycisphaerales bacterium]|nr:O-antigen ligase domain-containing protein [Phycisphaerales bacterium]
MTKLAVNSNFSKSNGQVIFEYILLAICLCVIALRTTLTETPTTQSTILPANMNDNVYSLILSAVLIFSFVVWLVWSFCSKRFLYRFTGIEIGLCLFIVAAVIASLAAANKRAAITGFVTMLAPVLMAVLLVQILDSQSKIKLLLTVIAALGVVSAYQCAEQFFSSNRMMIEQYEQAPQSILEPLGIQPGSFAQMLFEHRLYSKGVRSFFTTSNSAGSFAMLASFAAIALFLEEFRNRKFCASGFRRIFTSGIAVAIVIFGLALTQSKGAIIASLIAAAMFIAYLLFGNWLKRHKKAILIAGLLLVLAGGCLIVQYGLTHNRLPGGNSMLVRWQYWQSTAKMYADHPLTGVGPGNFAASYTRYKPPEALETISDPHNFLLSILTQYGPLGLIGFLAIVFLPLRRAISPANRQSPIANHSEPAFTKLAVPFVIVISAVLLLIRPLITPLTNGAAADVMVYAIFVLYVAPVVVFAVGFWLLTTPIRNTQYTIRNTNIAAALFCAVLGLLIHNLIDFAIFEPGVFTVLWAITACLIAIDFQRKSRSLFVL